MEDHVQGQQTSQHEVFMLGLWQGSNKDRSPLSVILPAGDDSKLGSPLTGFDVFQQLLPSLFVFL